MDLKQHLQKNRNEVIRIAAKHGATNVRVFGSVARNEADEASDVDLLVTVEPGRSLLDHAAMHLELARLLRCRVDVISDRGLKERFRERILAEALPL